MKSQLKKTLIVLFIFFSCGLSYSQMLFDEFVSIPSGTTNNLNFVSSNIIAGDNGVVLKTTNDGSNWFTIPTGYSNNFYSYCAGNSMWLSGSSGIIIKSSNSGTNWTSTNSGTNQNLRSIIYTINTNNYLLSVGDNGTIITTSNNGVNWVSLNSGTTQNLNCVKSASSKIYYVSGNGGKLLRINLNYPPLPIVYSILNLNSGTSADLKSLLVLDSNNVFAVGTNGTIIKTIDGGISWATVNSGFNQNFNNINYANGIIYVCGNNGALIKSTNMGVNWVQVQLNNYANINSQFFATVNFLVGNNGTILRSFSAPNQGGISTIYRVFLENNIRAYFQNTSIFDQNTLTTNTPGCEWPIGSGKNVIFTAGLTIAAKVNNELRMASASYGGEHRLGVMNYGVPVNDPYLMIYSVKRGQSCYNSLSWANWGKMVQYGAPYVDVNHNLIFDPCIDTPGVSNANQTIFMCLTDGYINSHNPGEGFGGGTQQLFADLKMTAWAYDDSVMKDVQFIKWEISNKGNNVWDSVVISLITDPDIGDGNDDYIGCDINRKLGFAYNADNNDTVYGVNPPAAGFCLLKLPVNKYVFPYDTIGLSSMVYFTNTGSSPPPCESDPNGEPLGAYNMMKGLKKDYSPWLNPTIVPPSQTKFVYTGDPETNIGWTEYKGSIQNCGGTSGNQISVNPSGDRRFLMSISKPGFMILPNQSYTVVAAQLVAGGSSNLNSVTKLKQYCDVIQSFYNSVGIKKIETKIPESYSLSQNYPNPFNPVTKIKFQVPSSQFIKIVVYDILGKEVATLVNESLQPGTYETTFDASSFPSGIYFYRLITNEIQLTSKCILLK